MFFLNDLILLIWKSNPHITDPKLIATIMQELLETMRLMNTAKIYSNVTPLNLVMLNYGDNTTRRIYMPHPAQIILTLEELNNIVCSGYTTNPDKALKSLTSHSLHDYIYFQFSHNGKLITQLPAAIIEPSYITPLELLNSSQQNRLLLYREQYLFHYQLSIYNTYLNLIINDNIPHLKILKHVSLEHINTNDLMQAINEIDSDFSTEFERSILTVQEAFNDYNPDLSSKVKSKLVIDIYNEIIIHPRIRTQNLYHPDLFKLTKALKTFKK